MVSVFAETFAISRVAQAFKVTPLSGRTTEVRLVVGCKLYGNIKVDVVLLSFGATTILAQAIFFGTKVLITKCIKMRNMQELNSR